MVVRVAVGPLGVVLSARLGSIVVAEEEEVVLKASTELQFKDESLSEDSSTFHKALEELEASGAATFSPKVKFPSAGEASGDLEKGVTRPEVETASRSSMYLSVSSSPLVALLASSSELNILAGGENGATAGCCALLASELGAGGGGGSSVIKGGTKETPPGPKLIFMPSFSRSFSKRFSVLQIRTERSKLGSGVCLYRLSFPMLILKIICRRRAYDRWPS